MSDDQDGCEWVFLLVPAYLGCPGKKPLNGCECVCACVSVSYDCSRTMNKSDHDLFCKLCAPMHALNHLLPPARNSASLRT